MKQREHDVSIWDDAKKNLVEIAERVGLGVPGVLEGSESSGTPFEFWSFASGTSGFCFGVDDR